MRHPVYNVEVVKNEEPLKNLLLKNEKLPKAKVLAILNILSGID